jgi:hypothetical protein
MATNYENGSSRLQVTAPTMSSLQKHKPPTKLHPWKRRSRSCQQPSPRWQTKATTARTVILTQAVAIGPANAPRIINHITQAGTATPMAITPLVPTTQVQAAVGKRMATRTKQCGPTPSVETHSGHLQGVSQSICKTMPHGRASQLPPVDRDRGQHYIQRTIPI